MVCPEFPMTTIMKFNLDKLQDAVSEWLIRNKLDTDTRFYSIEAWKKRGEEYLNDSELVLLFEGNLFTLLNYGGETQEFEDLVESFGYFYEQGHAWNMGFYRIDGYDFNIVSASYREKLFDQRWKKKIEKIKDRAGYVCEDCGTSDFLEIHHCYYIKGHEPWEYPMDALRCLCRQCHLQRAKSEIRMRAFMANLTGPQMDRLRQALDLSCYWFEKDAVLNLLKNLEANDKEILSAVDELLAHKINRYH